MLGFLLGGEGTSGKNEKNNYITEEAKKEIPNLCWEGKGMINRRSGGGERKAGTSQVVRGGKNLFHLLETG